MSAQQVRFFRKNKCDYSLSPTVSASEGTTYAARVCNRSNLQSWFTTGSVDANNTTLTVDMGDLRAVDSILLAKHNFKAFTVKYWNGSAYVAFSTPIAETNNTAASNFYSFTSVNTTKVQITITGTMVANADKYLYQLLLLETVGQLTAWPVIIPSFDKNKQITKMLSGKQYVVDNIGGYSAELDVKIWSSSADLTILEAIYDAVDGVTYWPCGGSESQFSSRRVGWRMEDIFLVRPTDIFKPEFYKGLYTSGLTIKLKLAEVIA